MNANKNTSNTIADSLKRHRMPRTCSFCGHDFLRHGIGEHAIKDHEKPGARCVDCPKKCEAFKR